MKSRAAELALDRLQAVVAGEPAAEARAHLAERQVDLVVHDQHPLQRQLERAARRADRAAGVVHVGLRAQHRHARRRARATEPRRARRDGGRTRPSAMRPRKRSFARPSSQRSASASATMKPTLWRVPACSRPGLPSPTISQSTAPPPPPPPKGRRRSCYSSPEEPSAPSASRLGASPAPRPRRRAPSRPRFPPPLRLCSRGGDSVATTVSSRSSSSVTPSGIAIAASTIVSPICISPTSCTIDSGIAVGSASHVQLARDLLEHAAFLDARGVLDAGQLERHDRVDRLVQAHAQQVDVDGLAAHRVALGLLEHDRRRLCRRRRSDRAPRRSRRARGAARARRRRSPRTRRRRRRARRARARCGAGAAPRASRRRRGW